MSFAIICSGGDSAGMNPAISYFVKYLSEKNIDSYLIYDGYEGLIDANIKKVKPKDVSGIIHKGGTIIRSSRSSRFLKKIIEI